MFWADQTLLHTSLSWPHKGQPSSTQITLRSSSHFKPEGHLASKYGPAMPGGTVCVLGAGVIGLTTALRIRQELPHLRVTLVAEDFGVNTTSHGSGGLWEVGFTCQILPDACKPDVSGNCLQSTGVFRTCQSWRGAPVKFWCSPHFTGASIIAATAAAMQKCYFELEPSA